MKNTVFAFSIFFAIVSQGFGQPVFIAINNGNWNGTNVWSFDGVTPISCGPCVAGTDYPGSGDIAVIAVTAGNAVTINGTYAVKDLYLVNNVAGTLRKSGFGTVVFTINGQLSGADPSLDGTLVAPSVNVFQVSMSGVRFTFTGTNIDIPSSGAITFWDYATPIVQSFFNPGAGNTIKVDNFSVNGAVTVQSGTLQLNSGQTIRDAGSSSLIVNSGCTFNVFGQVNGNGATSSFFDTITNNGTIATGNSAYINSVSFTNAPLAALNVGFTGVNQTEGWWYQGNSPTIALVDSTSTVTYSANGVQNVAAGVTYGNLALTSTTSAVKSLTGSGLTIQGNLVVGSNVTSTASSQVIFSGPRQQSISGSGTLIFNGGLEIAKSTSSLTLNKPLTISGGATVTQGTFNLGNSVTTFNSGDLNTLGTTTSGASGTLSVTGTSNFFGAGSLTLNNLTIGGATTIGKNAWSITGNLTNGGTLTLPSTSTVTFSGTTDQTISGNAFSLGNMVVNKGATTLLNNGIVNFTGLLTMTNGTFDADGGTLGTGSGIFRLVSNASGDAAIGVITNGSIKDNVTFERFFVNSITKRWRNIGFPVTGVTYTALGAAITLKTNSLAYYTEATAGNVEQGFSYVNSGTLPDAKGFSVWMYNNGPKTISVRGPLLKQDKSTYNYNVDYHNNGPTAADVGWNFVANPYASPIDWNSASGWSNKGTGHVNSVASIWDEEGNAYRLTNAGNNIIAQGQGFWVQTNAGSPLLTSSGAVKVVNTNPDFYRKATDAENSKLLVNLKSDDYYDVAVVQFRDDATPEFDNEFDAYKLKNPIFNITTITNGGAKLASNVMPKSVCTSNIRIDITNIDPGTYSLRFDGVSSFNDVNSISLVDHFTQNTQKLVEGKSYSFEVTADEKSFGADRFQLAFDFTDLNVTPLIVKENNKLVSNFEEGNQWYLNETLIAGATANRFTPTLRGAYSVVVHEGMCDLRSEPFIVNEGLSRIFPNPASEYLKVDVYNLLSEGSSGNILLYSTKGQLIRSEAFTAKDNLIEMDIKGLSPGPYVLTIVSGNGTIHEKSKVVIE